MGQMPNTQVVGEQSVEMASISVSMTLKCGYLTSRRDCSLGVMAKHMVLELASMLAGTKTCQTSACSTQGTQ